MKLISLTESAEILNINRASVYGLCKSGKIPYQKIGNQIVINESDVLKHKTQGHKGIIKRLKDAGAYYKNGCGWYLDDQRIGKNAKEALSFIEK